MTLITIIVLILVIVLGATLFINLSPQFGKAASKDQIVVYRESDNYQDGKFINQIPTTMDIDFLKVFGQYWQKAPNRAPKTNIEVELIDSLEIVALAPQITQLTWFGHSAFLLELDGKKILLDPMFGDTPSPHPWLGTKRYSKNLPIEIEKLPYIDAVIFSHDHYDHLDYGSIKLLKDKVGTFYTPLGVGNHLVDWGVEEERIFELDWWDSIKLDEINLVCAPARHFSGRGLFDRSTTLWSSWVIQGEKDNIYFSGDGGYGPHFKEIGEQYGPFDIAMMECGQYNEQWEAIHMMPEQTAQAGTDVKAKLLLPIHWGAFTLAMHDWYEPVERVSKAALELGMPITTPKIGEVIVIGEEDFPMEKWWLNY